MYVCTSSQAVPLKLLIIALIGGLAQADKGVTRVPRRLRVDEVRTKGEYVQASFTRLEPITTSKAVGQKIKVRSQGPVSVTSPGCILLNSHQYLRPQATWTSPHPSLLVFSNKVLGKQANILQGNIEKWLGCHSLPPSVFRVVSWW